MSFMRAFINFIRFGRGYQKSRQSVISPARERESSLNALNETPGSLPDMGGASPEVLPEQAEASMHTFPPMATDAMEEQKLPEMDVGVQERLPSVDEIMTAQSSVSSVEAQLRQEPPVEMQTPPEVADGNGSLGLENILTSSPDIPETAAPMEAATNHMDSPPVVDIERTTMEPETTSSITDILTSLDTPKTDIVSPPPSETNLPPQNNSPIQAEALFSAENVDKENVRNLSATLKSGFGGKALSAKTGQLKTFATRVLATEQKSGFGLSSLSKKRPQLADRARKVVVKLQKVTPARKRNVRAGMQVLRSTQKKGDLPINRSLKSEKLNGELVSVKTSLI